ncbi:NADPH-glutathione reductase [Nitrosomonas nitrosa]|uniref:Glutathione reductase n=1 Tax=Nitrosomonas nitrosa TaxID=52442 RepID=A0A1I4R9X5_9PROT|nr:glutathione-disulfide reductase [Nitrosomonas nitrosa]PTR04681.1 NADPH-glutathione reductase [Nitrosomonas nitrosa]SFM48770.1 NADPH-glutathione reductase [Nitrosomonas nitrosa]
MNYNYDLFVIGAGSGGVRASRMASSFGAKVAVCEDLYIGGTCVNVGCVPKKLYVYASEYAAHFHDAKGFGWQMAKPKFDWPTLRQNKTAEIRRLNAIYEDILDQANVDIIEGRGKILDPHTVEVAGQRYSAERILIAVGGWPFIPDVPGREYAVSTNEIFDLESFPERIVVVGGGYVAVEFAGIFNGLGAQVTQLYRGELFLRGFDNEVRQFAAQEIRKKGVDIWFNADVTSIDKQNDGHLTVHTNIGKTLTADAVLYATGRKPRLADLGLENVNVNMTDSGHIQVNEHLQTDEPNIFALGDVTGGLELTPVALAEGTALARSLYNNESYRLDYSNIATTVFCQPNIGTIGMTEEQARRDYPNVEKYRTIFTPMKHAISGSDEKTLMKLLVDGDTGKILGAHMVGADAGEIMQGIAIAIKAGATKADFDATIGIHPTAAEEFVTMREPVDE